MYHYRFGPFQVDPRSGELRRNGIRIRLQEQPFQVLVALLERPGELVSREELRNRLWPTDTFVNFENSLNSAVNRLRDALGDSADNPHYIETLPRRGYRFIAQATTAESGSPKEPEAAQTRTMGPPHSPAGPAAPPSSAPYRSGKLVWVATAAMAILLAIAGFLMSRSDSSGIPAGKIMLAILPFDDLTGAEDHQYFVEGLTDELILQLGKLRPARLGVIARTSILQYRGTRKPIDQIGRELGVQYVLTGTVRAARAQATTSLPALLISAQLVQVSDQSSLWTESYEHSVQDFFSAQTDVAVRVTRSLTNELLPDLQNSLAQTQQISPEARAAYLKGRFFWNQRSQAGAEGALSAAKYFEETTQLEPQFAAAHAALASAQLSLATGGVRKMEEVLPLARQANTRALALDPNLAEAYSNLARISLYYDRDWAAAEKLFQKALELNANSSDTRFYYSLLLMGQKRYADGKAQLDRARETDPLSPSPWLMAALLAERMGDPSLALASSRRHAELLGNPQINNFIGGQILAWAGRCEEALQGMRQVNGQVPRPAALDQYSTEEAIIFHRCGDQAASRKAYLRAVSLPSIIGVHRGLLEGALGSTAEACRQLDRAVRDKDPSIQLLNIDVRFDSIRDQPCFQKILKTVGLPQ